MPAEISSTGAERPRVSSTDLVPPWMRVGLLALAVPCTVLGVWLLFSPHSFYWDFPGLGQHWVRPLGPYNEHAFSDFGGALLALSLVVWVAAWALERRLVTVALSAVLLWGTAHFVYHLMHLDVLRRPPTLGIRPRSPISSCSRPPC